MVSVAVFLFFGMLPLAICIGIVCRGLAPPPDAGGEDPPPGVTAPPKVPRGPRRLAVDREPQGSERSGSARAKAGARG